MRPVVFLLVVICAVAIDLAAPKRAAVHASLRKHLAGPPSEFVDHVLPDPVAQRLQSQSAMLIAKLSGGENGGFAWSQQVPVDSKTLFTCTVISYIPILTVKFQPPSLPTVVEAERTFLTLDTFSSVLQNLRALVSECHY